MTRVAIDTEQAQRAAAQLLDAAPAYRVVGRRLMAGGVTGMPPHVATHVANELAEIEADLRRQGAQLEYEGEMLRRRARLLATSDAEILAMWLLGRAATVGAGVDALLDALAEIGVPLPEGGFQHTTTVGPFGLSSWGEWFAGVDADLTGAAGFDDGWHSVLEGRLFAGLRGGIGHRIAVGGFALESEQRGWAGVSGSVDHRLDLDGHGLERSEAAAIAIGGERTLRGRVGFDRAYVETRLGGFAGARASIDRSVVLRSDRVAVSGHAGAFAGVEATFDREVRLGGVSTHGGIGVARGFGGDLGGGAELSLDRVGFQYNGRLAFIVGGSIDLGAEIRPREVMSDVAGATSAVHGAVSDVLSPWWEQ